ncbi:AbfB domain-containing protein [Amycolatopsis sp. SID8362]|uniref:AbfB domain-containing protein n=1 Tax=Amycolatopsis sp. SID8362 TaxID=2690346 RepID=UPI00136A29D3|nr:AbfB domain-containing protein [Amycolatopsis sp. SID8362]NBH11340.1 beta-galactosidase [Amycolatopsis sp. SID8362]NED48032.1 beta-galactosidase [Amycolatopsis sp. SID8362]
MRRFVALVLALLSPLVVVAPAANAAVTPKPPPLSTPWTSQVSTTNPLPDYPRPQMQRSEWQSLNGEWEFLNPATGAGGSVDRYAAPPLGQTLPERILVPYPVESALSGIMRNDNRDLMFYRRTFTVPSAWAGRNVQLHFGAVDYEATVWVNGVQVASHKGGYDRFEADITARLTGGSNEIVVRVYDPTDGRGEKQPVGKQANAQSSIFYTPTSGIWQTVWLEPTAPSSIFSVDIYPNLANNTARVRVFGRGDVTGYSVLAESMTGGAVVGSATGGFTEFSVPVPNARRWSPDDPFLYDLRVSLRNASGATVDQVVSYFGMREVGTKNVNGVLRPTLNGEFVFQAGTLDQGFWPDGLYTAPTDAALASDLQKHKDLGFNMVRKHIKVEPARWYYWADRLGLLVWQDIPSTPTGDSTRTAAQIAEFETEAREIVDEHRFSPAVITYVPFNEGWGEWNLDETRRVTTNIKNQDPTRLVNAHSGFNCCASKGDPGTGDIIDWHVYTGPDAPRPSGTRVSVLGEFGGLGLRNPGHEYSPTGGFFAYEQMASAAQLNDRFTGMIRDTRQLMLTKGLSASVYTEITDVEGEYNGLLTYDRRVQKVDTARVRAAHADLINASKNLNAAVPLTLGHLRSFRVTTPGYTDRYLRHADSFARTDVLTTGSADGPRQDASFRTVAGLANPRCFSFESVNFPGKFLRHADNRVRIDSDTGGSFTADATWCARPGLAAGGTSFESANFPGRFLRHYNETVYLALSGGPNAWDTATSFAADATWDVSAPALWRSSVPLTVNARQSLRVTTWGYTDRYLRHSGGLAYTEVVNSGSSALLKQDATYTVRRGLGESSCYSFESVNYPGQFLRHQDGRVRNSPDDGSALMRADATFCTRPGVGGTGVTFESLNIPGAYLRHFDSAVYIASGAGTGSDRPQTVTADSSWTVAAPWAP